MSEFGTGVVVCLAKFSEHLTEHGPFGENRVLQYLRWHEMSADEQGAMRREAEKYPKGDSAMFLAAVSIGESYGGRDNAVSHMIEMWMNAASDHFYDLDRDRAPKPLLELADLTLRIGHGFTGEQWTKETIDQIRDLWRESCLAVDRALGTNPDWGEW